MILSVSRRTDIPNYYSEWFFNRLKAGFLCVKNPMNAHQISRIPLSPETVDCIVFWTKNPEPMMERLSELSMYPFYFQFTLTGYGKDIESGIPHKREHMIGVFKRLSEEIGSHRVIWRYDPILFNERYSPDYHLRAFGQIAESLRGYTEKCVLSFVDRYGKNRRRMDALGIYEPDEGALLEFAAEIARIAGKNGIAAASCAERMDLSACGIVHNSCIDRELIERLTGCGLAASRDRNQRAECGCVESIDVGTYDTCRSGCVYCYANVSGNVVSEKRKAYDPESPILCGRIGEGDRVTERKVRSLRDGQMRF